MCGIAGYIKRTREGQISNAADLVKDLTYFNQVRGIDAFGMFKVHRLNKGDKTDEIMLMKMSGHPYAIVQSKKFEDMLKWPGDVRYMVAHNRLATKGEKTELCAQPFSATKESGKQLVLVHNGTINNIHGEKDFPGKTDSEQLCKMLASGMTLTEFESRLWGSFSIVWYDEDDGSLNLFRNEDRPMGMVKTKNAIFFGSEPYLVAAAVFRKNAGPIDEISNTMAFDHWKYHYDDGKWETTKVTRVKKASGVSQLVAPWDNVSGLPINGETLEDLYGAEQHHVGPRSSIGGTVVKPFVAPDYTKGTGAKATVAVYPSKPTNDPKWRRRQKTKYAPVHEAMGFSKGDTIDFSLVSCRETRRSNQLVVEDGVAVTYGMNVGPGNLTVMPRIRVYGMMGGKTMEDVSRVNCVYTGIIASINESRVEYQTIKEYKIHVKDIKPTTNFDPFRAVHRTKGELKIGEAPIVLTRKTEDREFSVREKEKTNANTWLEKLVGPREQAIAAFICDFCQTFHPPSAIHPFKKVFEFDDTTVLVRACQNCNNAIVKDQTKLLAMFESKRQAQVLLDKPTTPETRTIQ